MPENTNVSINKFVIASYSVYFWINHLEISNRSYCVSCLFSQLKPWNILQWFLNVEKENSYWNIIILKDFFECLQNKFFYVAPLFLHDWFENFETKLLRLRIIFKRFFHFEPYSYKKDSYIKKIVDLGLVVNFITIASVASS